MIVQFPKQSNFLVFALCAYAIVMSIHHYIEKYVDMGAFWCSNSNKVRKFYNFLVV